MTLSVFFLIFGVTFAFKLGEVLKFTYISASITIISLVLKFKEANNNV